MLAVIFTAQIKLLDEEYNTTARQLRERAVNLYDCIDLISVLENGCEITISYWNSEEDIHKWKQDQAHLRAQELGRNRWYETYQVQVVEVKRSYTQ